MYGSQTVKTELLAHEPQLRKKRIHHARTGKQGKGHGIDQHPADEIGQGGQGLYRFLKPFAADLRQENGKGHRQPGCQDCQSAHGKGIAKHP